MKYTRKKAENILTKVFKDELAGESVTIDLPTATGVSISATSFNSLMLMISKEPSMKIQAIRLYREAVPGTGLAEAKTYVENLAVSRVP